MDTEIARRARFMPMASPHVDVASDWAIDTGYSVVQFGVKHLGFTTARGRFTDIRGTIRCGDTAHSASASVEVIIAATSFATGDIQQDAYLRSIDFLDVERYPTISFTSTRVERMAKNRLGVTMSNNWPWQTGWELLGPTG